MTSKEFSGKMRFGNCKNPDCYKAFPAHMFSDDGLCQNCERRKKEAESEPNLAELAALTTNTFEQLANLEKSYKSLISGVRQAVATYHVNPDKHTELATIMCEFLEGKRK